MKAFILSGEMNFSWINQIKLSKNVPDELLYGRSGYLWACLFLNKHIGEGTISASIMVSAFSVYATAYGHRQEQDGVI